MTVVYRIQDQEGRGPFRPGFTKSWRDHSKPTPMLPTWFDEFGWDAFERFGRLGEHYGSAVRDPKKLCDWFLPDEMRKLDAYGFKIVALSGARVLAESANQLIFGRMRPLHDGAEVQVWP